jgi:hypothetical protein
MFGGRAFSDVPFETVVQRARILVIDDQEFPYLTLFRRDNYTVEKWNDVKNLPKIESGFYDLLLLDLQGVGRAVAGADEGLGVLKHLKSVRPFQLVLAYSNAEFQVRYQPFFQLADGVLQKTADYFEFKREVDALLRDHFSAGFHLNRIQSTVAEEGLPESKSMRHIKRAIRERDAKSAIDYLKRTRVDVDSLDRILRLIEITFKMVDLWKN